jgi:hypothetical protein
MPLGNLSIRAIGTLPERVSDAYTRVSEESEGQRIGTHTALVERTGGCDGVEQVSQVIIIVVSADAVVAA